jgi:hypothetical protein
MCISPIQYTRQFVVYALLISSFLMSCNNERVDTQAVVQEMRDRQIKRVNPAQVMALADDWGKNIAKQLKKNAATTLLNNQLKDSLSKAYAANIQFLSPINFDLPSLAELERQVLDAYQYSVDKKLPQSDNIQRLPDQQTLLFTSPVLWNDDFTKLSKVELAQLSQKFQLDSLLFRKKGDFLGVWSIKLQKKEIIRRTDAKTFEKAKSRIEQYSDSRR